MKIFENDIPDIDGYRPNTMSQVEYLKRGKRMQAVRDTLELWFSNYPPHEQIQLKSGLLSNDNAQHASAFFELFLYQMLLQFGWEITVHPEVTGSSNRPDFLCEKDGQSFYLEAKLETEYSEEDRAAVERLNVALDVVNRRVKNDRFSLGLSTEGLPADNMVGRSIANELSSWLESLNHEQCLKDRLDQQFPVKIINRCGCRLEFEAYARVEDGEDRQRIIVTETFGHIGGFISPQNAIKNAVNVKANRYGTTLDKPYIIAINTQDRFIKLKFDVLSGLYGDECLQVTRLVDGTTHSGAARSGNGVFGNFNKPLIPHVSGVFVFNDLSITALAHNHNGLFVPNIYSIKPIGNVCPSVSELSFNGQGFVHVKGEPLTTILGLPENWPFNTDEAWLE